MDSAAVTDAATMPDSADGRTDGAQVVASDTGAGADPDASAVTMPDSGTDASTSDGGCTGPSYSQVVLSDNPILYFRLGEPAGSTTAADAVPSGVSGAYHGVHSGVPGAIVCDSDTAASFDGSAVLDIPNVPDFSGQQSFTIEAWVKPTALSTTNFAHILSDEYDDTQSNRQGYALMIGYGGYGFGVERAVSGVLDKAILGNAPSTTRYTHVVGVYDGTSLLLYTDGVAGPTNVDTRTMLSSGPPLAAFLGAFSDTSRDFTGDLDEVALYDVALPAARVMAHYTKGAFGY